MSQASPQKVICICSWQRGFQHGTFNAALLQTIACAFPDHQLRYHADASQTPYLQKVLDMSLPDLTDRLKFFPLHLGPPRTVLGMTARFTSMMRMVQLMKRPETDCFVFADLGSPMLSLLKRLIALFSITIPIVVIAHGLFEPLGWSTTASLSDIPPLRTKSPQNLRLVVLGEHIQEALVPYQVGSRHDLRVFPHPVLQLRERPTDQCVNHRFVFPGVPDKGLRRFTEIATIVRQTNPQAQFAAAGFASSQEERDIARSSSVSVADAPLSIRDYFHQLATASHGVWFSVHEPDPYQFRASGTIPDLIASGRPTFFIRNKMVDGYFTRFGNIGKSCASVEELIQQITLGAEHTTPEEEHEWHTHLEHARSSLSPMQLAFTFRDIVTADSQPVHV